ncbi:hypothetical protein ACNF40_01820 [Cuniculiplasma sp. SKW4]|uniref:hypothetical protein n=1 Tax=Cuniculiplasma sp. SKW4 TaxID=3400171 RepID=UPI003FCF49D4
MGGKMKMDISFLLSLSGGLIFFLAFLLSADSNVGYVLASLYLFFFLISVILPSRNKGEQINLNGFSKIKFFTFLFPILAIIFSTGYVSSFAPSLSAINPKSAGFLSLLLLILEFSIILLISQETSGKLWKAMVRSGYDPAEVRRELNSFSTHVSEIGAGVLIVSFGFIFLLVFAPEVNVGIIPAVIVFIVVYALVIGNLIRKN